jgi:hypothetical protein
MVGHPDIRRGHNGLGGSFCVDGKDRQHYRTIDSDRDSIRRSCLKTLVGYLALARRVTSYRLRRS